MKLKKALKEFEALKQKHESGKLSDQKFEKQVAKISAEDDAGEQWMVDANGSWHKNVNGEWKELPVSSAKINKGPQSLLQLFWMIAKGMVTNLPKRLLWFAIIGVITFLVHTYLVIYPNGGFWQGTNPTLDKILALVGNEARGTVFWTISAYLLTSIIRRMFSVGPKKFITGIFTGPVRVVKSTFSKTGKFLSFFMMSMVVFLLLGQFLLKNTAIAYTFIISAVMGIITFRADLSYLILRLGYQDVTKLFKRKNAKFNDIYFDAYQLAMIVAMLIYSFLSGKPILIYAICGFSVAMLIFAKFRKTNKVAANLFLLGAVGLNLAFVYMMKVYADDGGVAEAGGLKNWIGSPGAGQAVTVGLPPSVGAGIGGLVGIVTGGGDFVGTFDEDVDYGEDVEYPESELEDLPEDQTEEETTDDEETEESSEDTEDTEDSEGDEEDEEEDEEEDTFTEKFEEEMVENLEELQDLIFGTPEEQLDVIKDWAEKGYELPGELGDLISSGQDFVLTSDIMDTIFEKYDEIVPDWFEKGAEDAANEAWDALGLAKDLFGDYLPEGSPISDIMDGAGVLKDTLDNIGMGDNAIYAGIKSYLSNKIKNVIFDNPACAPLAIVEKIVAIFAGGSRAGDVLSPAKTVQGGANFIIDKLTDLYNGTDDVSGRLKDGKYGGTWKEMDNLTEFVAESAYDPDFKKDFDNVVTSDDFYEGMYKSNEEMWKPKEGSWAIKRAGCYVGKKATEQFINVASGVKNLSSWLGSWI
ncbi:MAG: hypothetical protein JXQ26_04270 [Tissierellales bacterium]|nr:hypothetical protein [Tissierellales bacterium]MBN2827178.1 hypothetical protein [Tissierellales bacterium]